MPDVFLSKDILISEEEETSPAVQYEIAGREMKGILRKAMLYQFILIIH